MSINKLNLSRFIIPDSKGHNNLANFEQRAEIWKRWIVVMFFDVHGDN